MKADRTALLLAAAVIVSSACDVTTPGDSPRAKDTAALTSTHVDGSSPYKPGIDPADFVETIDNPFFSLIPGTKYKLRGRPRTVLNKRRSS